jgi:hypothetical protein
MSKANDSPKDLPFRFGPEGVGHGRLVACPVCGFEYNRVVKPLDVGSGDDYGVWKGRGDLWAMELKGECGSEWALCLGFHKGQTFVYCRVFTPCER